MAVKSFSPVKARYIKLRALRNIEVTMKLDMLKWM